MTTPTTSHSDKESGSQKMTLSWEEIEVIFLSACFTCSAASATISSDAAAVCRAMSGRWDIRKTVPLSPSFLSRIFFKYDCRTSTTTIPQGWPVTLSGSSLAAPKMAFPMLSATREPSSETIHWISSWFRITIYWSPVNKSVSCSSLAV